MLQLLRITTHRTTLLREVTVAAPATSIAVALWSTGALRSVDTATGDVLLRVTHRERLDVPLVAIAIDDVSIAAVGPLPWPRHRLAMLIGAARRAGATGVVLDLLLLDPGNADDDLTLADALDAGPSVLAAALAPDGRWLLPAGVFGGANRAAHVHAEVASDGVVRTLIATKQAGDLALPAMSLAAARILRPELPITPGQEIRPDFRPAPSRITGVSAADVLTGRSGSASMKGAVVFIGVTAAGAGDRLIVPTEPGPAPAPGVLVHASATASLFRDGLVHRVGAGWIVLGCALATGATQRCRSHAGTFRPRHLAAVLVVAAAVSVAALQGAHLLVTPIPPALAAVVAVLTREAVESRAAQHESGRLLTSLLRHHGIAATATLVPATAADRLSALHELQSAVLREDRTRRALLDGMADGVVMWNGLGEVVIANPAAERLWGGEPSPIDLTGAQTAAGGDRPGTVRRHGLEIAISVADLDDGGLAILRDVTAERELERRRRDMQRLVSHELRTPLASIAGLGETIERYELDRHELQRVASLIRNESTRLGAMVSTFLDLERLASGGWEPSESPVDLSAVVAQRLAILDQTAHSKDQVIERRLEEGTWIRADPALLDRVVDNLVANAVHYSPTGATVSVDVRHRDDDVILSVADHGPGIPEEAIPHLFERFYRVPGSRAGGSGLGLAVAQEVVTWHGGCILVDSTVGQGTTFTVRLPGERRGHESSSSGR